MPLYLLFCPRPAVPSPTRTVPDGPGFSQGVKYIPEEEKVGGDVSQSKTFKILQSLMQNDGQYNGNKLVGINFSVKHTII